MNNMFLFVALIILCISLAASILHAQERLTPEEMFRWFPEGKYDGASFYHLSAVKNLPAYQMISDKEGLGDWNDSMLLPSILKDRWDYSIEMTNVKIGVLQQETVPRNNKRNRFKQYSIGDKTYVTNHIGYPMQVISFPAELNLIKLINSQRGIIITDEIISGLPVYYDETEKTSVWTPDNYYFCITPENYFLACENLQLLDRMVKTGQYLIPSVMDDFPFPYLLDMFPDLNQQWRINDNTASLNALLIKLEKDEVEQSLIDKMFENKHYLAPSVTDMNYKQEPVERRFTIYENSRDAELALQRTKNADLTRKPHSFASQNYRWSLYKYSTQGNYLVSTFVFSDEFINTYYDMRKEDQRKYLELKEQKEKEKMDKEEKIGDQKEK